jgi:hypothetical protein
MATILDVGDTLPDFELPDHNKSPRRLSQLTRPSLLDEKLGRKDGYPLILVFGRACRWRGAWYASLTSRPGWDRSPVTSRMRRYFSTSPPSRARGTAQSGQARR